MGRLDDSTIRAVERKAAQGMTKAQFELGLIYSTGNGAKLDYVTAHMWFNLAAAGGNREALSHRADLARDMTHDEIASAQRLAREHSRAH